MSKLTENYEKLAQTTGLRYDAANNLIYGERNGFQVILKASDSRYPYMLTIQTTAKNAAGTLLDKNEKKELIKSVDKIANMKQEGNQFSFFQKNIANQEKLATALINSLDGVISFLRTKGFSPCCSLCGQAVETSPFQVGLEYRHLCPDCEVRLRDSKALAAQAKAQKKENVVGGVVGALLGSLLGVICIVLLSQMGYVAALSGVIMAVGVLKGYELLGGKMTKKGIVISSIIMLLMTYIGDRLDWAILLLGEGGGADAGYNLFECYRLVPDMISMEIIESANYIANLFMLYLFLLLGAVPTIISKVKEKQVEGSIVKIGSAGTYASNIQ
ncbi:MAG: hypothetical protein MRZ49_05220 [Lachnospiraceae bacterium]|nr:hypothetical protein [Lachnospiraceae bacterium]